MKSLYRVALKSKPLLNYHSTENPQIGFIRQCVEEAPEYYQLVVNILCVT